MNAIPQPDIKEYKRYVTSLGQEVEKPKVRAYSTAILSLLAISLFVWFAIKPTLQTIFYLRREIEDKQIVNIKMEDKISALIEAQNTYQQIQPSLQYLQEAIPRNTEPLEFIIQLKRLSDLSGASISDIQISPVKLTGQNTTDTNTEPVKPQKTNATTESFPLTVTIAGSYESVAAFLKGILAMRRIATIQTLTLNAKSSTFTPTENTLIVTQNPTIQLDVGLITYYRK